MSRRLWTLAAAAPLLVLAACGSDSGPDFPSPEDTAPPDLDTIPTEPYPEQLPSPFIFRGSETAEAETPTEILYTVEPGDTLSVIAERFGVTMDALQRINGIADPSILRPGDELRVPVLPGSEAERIAATLDTTPEDFSGPPPGEEYVIQEGDTLSAIGVSFGIPWPEIAAYNRLSEAQAGTLIVGTTLIIPPQEEEAEEEEEAAEPPG